MKHHIIIIIIIRRHFDDGKMSSSFTVSTWEVDRKPVLFAGKLRGPGSGGPVFVALKFGRISVLDF